MTQRCHCFGPSPSFTEQPIWTNENTFANKIKLTRSIVPNGPPQSYRSILAGTFHFDVRTW